MGDMVCRHRSLVAFGIIMIILGVGAIICGVLNKIWYSYANFYHQGFWSGTWLIITGIVGIIGGQQWNRGCEIAFMVLSILFSIFLWSSLMATSVISFLGDYIWGYGSYSYYYSYVYNSDNNYSTTQSSGMIRCREVYDSGTSETRTICSNMWAYPVDIALMVIAVLVFLISILSASFACCAVCRCCGATGESKASVYPIMVA